VVVIYGLNSSSSGYHLLVVLTGNPGGHKFEDDREVGTVVTRGLITQDTNHCQQRREKLDFGYDKCLNYFGMYL
jgi:hypothetical protein